MSSTESLNGSVCDVLNNASFPHLRRLTVQLSKDADDEQQIAALASHSGSALISAKMALKTPLALRQVLTHTPCVTHLTLVMGDDLPCEVRALVGVLQSSLLPELESLEIGDPPQYEVNLDAIIEMLRFRCERIPGRNMLRLFTVILPGRNGFDFTPFAAVRALPPLTVMMAGGYGTTDLDTDVDALWLEFEEMFAHQRQENTVPSRSQFRFKEIVKKVIRSLRKTS
ncbi:hypothetical protein C8R46DRAFT_1358736 [Mycena filopes]|nr:hypothetical protein C8R46DRAFT_1358736 [Mycena filopes]